MSYILDALKRSEQERHQDKVADLSQDLLILQRKQQKKSVWPIILACLLVVNVLVLAFFLFSKQGDSGETLVSDLQHAPENEQGKESLSEKQPPRPIGGAIYQSHYTANAPANAQHKSIPNHVQKKVNTQKLTSFPQQESARHDSSSSENVTYTAEGYELITPKSQVLSRSENTVVAAMSVDPADSDSSSDSILYSGFEVIRPSGATTSGAVMNDSTNSESRQANFTDVVSPNDETTSEESPRGVDSFSSIPHLTDLSLSTQKSVPDLVFNSHIYSDNPGARRVMINNLYMREGDAFSGMTIKQIGEEYIHLELGSENFKVPVLRDWVRP